MCHHTEKFGVTAKLQEVASLLASGYVFTEAEEILHNLLGIELSAKQVQRISEHYGQKLEESEASYQDMSTDVPLIAAATSASPVYITMDGSMVYTREDAWKEMKMGRIYSGTSRVEIQKNRTEIMDSLYVCTLGNNKDFLKKLEPYVEPYQCKIFIADGAKWIWNWVDDFYSDSVQILDFYHAVEKLGAYALIAYKDVEKRRQWLDFQKQRLKADEIEKVLDDLKKIAAKTLPTTQIGKSLKDIIHYYENNIERMKYGTFIKKGFLIGSGAIESAHRNVIQQRLKLSGQRWSIKGAQRIVNLRAYWKSKRWNDLTYQIKMAA
ncbi:MAG: hypothetical protein FWG84_00945 [Bacteroidales bacterium]|nr:hypothetical protein [Bacteroidales bacterium]